MLKIPKTQLKSLAGQVSLDYLISFHFESYDKFEYGGLKNQCK